VPRGPDQPSLLYLAGPSIGSTKNTMPDNGYIEAFNSKLRSECLNAHWSMTLADATEKLEDWRRYYNEDRPHSAIGYNVPIALHNPGDETSPSP
jgi:putative transposase